METREKLIRLLPVFLFLLAMLILLGSIICPQIFNSVIYIMAPIVASGASRNYCLRKYSYNPKWERNFRILLLSAGFITLVAVIGYLAWTSLM